MIWRTFLKEVLTINPKLTDPFNFKLCDRGKVYFIFSTQDSKKILLVLLSFPARRLHHQHSQAQLCKANILRLFFKSQLRSSFLHGIKKLDCSQKIYEHLFQFLNVELNRKSVCLRVGLIIQRSGDNVLASDVCQEFCIRAS